MSDAETLLDKVVGVVSDAVDAIVAAEADDDRLPPNWPLTGIDPHPFANIFRMMTEEELADLTKSVDEHGLREKIVILEGKILDGRNRYLAGVRAGLFPADVDWRADRHFVVFGGKGWDPNQLDPLDYVWDHNFNRRHDDVGQRAMAAARYAKRRQGFRSDLSQAEPDANLREVTPADAAQRAGISERSLSSAFVVLDHGTPELQHAVDEGKIAISAAEKAARLDPIEQRIIAENPIRPKKPKARPAEPEKPQEATKAQLLSFAMQVMRIAEAAARQHLKKGNPSGASISADAVLRIGRMSGLGYIVDGDDTALKTPDADPEVKHVEQLAPEDEYRALIAIDIYRGRHTKATAEPILRAGVAANIKRKQIAEALGHPEGTISTWCNRLGLQDRSRLLDPERAGRFAASQKAAS
jgi:ParB-like chromosome segregation protein Spo0J